MSATLSNRETVLDLADEEPVPVPKKTRQIRVESDVADMADRLARLQDPPQSTPDFLSKLLRPILRRELGKALDRARRQLNGREDE